MTHLAQSYFNSIKLKQTLADLPISSHRYYKPPSTSRRLNFAVGGSCSLADLDQVTMATKLQNLTDQYLAYATQAK